MLKTIASTLALSFSLVACASGSQNAGETAPVADVVEPAQEVPAPAPTEADAQTTPDETTPDEATPAAESETFSAEIGSITKTRAPLTSLLKLTAASTTNGITLSFSNFGYYCEPAPSFVASAEGTVLTVTLEAPTAAVSKCFAKHDLSVNIALPGRSNLRTVSVISDKGHELAKGDELANAVIGQ